jgi:hypothetical protein
MAHKDSLFPLLYFSQTRKIFLCLPKDVSAAIIVTHPIARILVDEHFLNFNRRFL